MQDDASRLKGPSAEPLVNRPERARQRPAWVLALGTELNCPGTSASRHLGTLVSLKLEISGFRVPGPTIPRMFYKTSVYEVCWNMDMQIKQMSIMYAGLILQLISRTLGSSSTTRETNVNNFKCMQKEPPLIQPLMPASLLNHMQTDLASVGQRSTSSLS